MKLWEKGINPEPAIIEFTAGKDRKTDLSLTKWDIICSMAHVIMLENVGLVSEEEKNGLLKALHSLFVWDEEGSLVIENDVEDIHSQIEKEMSSILGTTGKKIHTGRSRNDQVLVDIRLYTREEIDQATKKPMLQRMYQLMRFRNTYPAFSGDITVGEDNQDGTLCVTWKKATYYTTLTANFRTKTYSITYFDADNNKECTL